MTLLDDIARAAISGDALQARSLAQDWLAATRELAAVSRPNSHDATLLAVSASLIELFAMRRGEPPPTWTQSVGALDAPLFLVRSALTMPNLRQQCEKESPAPMRNRRIFVPPDYLTAA